MKVHLVLKSSNVKVGKIPVSTSEPDSCPSTCPLRFKGCYGKTGPLSLHWRKVPERGMDWKDFCSTISSLPENQLWRHNQAGDLPHVNETIDASAVAELVNANKGKRGYTYTHHIVTENAANAATVKACNENGFTVNLSADNMKEADEMASLNIGPVCVILPSDASKNTVTPKGKKVVICPAVTKEGVSCVSCRLCANAKRSVIIGFPAHGTQKKVATAVSQSS